MQRSLWWLAGVVACSAHDPAVPPAEARLVPTDVAVASKSPGLRLPEGVTPIAYDLRLELDPDADVFRGTVAIDVRIDGPTDHVWIHADRLEITAATVREGTRTAALTPLAIAGDQMLGYGLGATVEHRTITLGFEFTGHASREEEGLFRQRSGAGRWYLFSQGETVFARRITPCFDEPRFKTPWKVTLVVPAGQRGLGNMPVARDAELADGRHELAFVETPPMASYLLAVAVGPFEIVDAGVVGQHRIPVRVVALDGDRERVGVVARRLPAIVDAIEAYVGDPLPGPKLDLVAVPHLFGAMENPGLITFDASILVGDPAQRGFSAYFTRVAAHEIAHQWFGNLVTPAWWDDLWLSEAFASWLGDRVAAEIGAFDQPQVRRALTREHALEVDASASARPLRHAIERNDDPDNAFDAIAYDKGAAVLASFEAWIGVAPFRSALRAYLHAHRDGNATTADLIAAIGAASTPAVAGALAGYIAESGAPVVDVALACGAGTPRLVAHARDGMTVPLCVQYGSGRGPGARACTLVGAHAELELAASRCPQWVYATDTGYSHVAWSTNGARGPAPPLAQLAPSERIALGDDLAAAIQRGDLALPAALGELRELAGSRDVYGEYAAVAIARAIDPIVDDDVRAAWASWLAATFAPRLAPDAWFAPPRSVVEARIRDDLERMIGEQAPKLTVQRARALVAAAFARHVPPDPFAVALAGDRATFDRLVALAHAADADVREPALDALGELGPAFAEPAVALVASDLPAHATLAIVGAYLERGATRTSAWAAVRAQLPGLLAHLSGVEAGELIDDAATLCVPAARAEVAATFEPHAAEIVDGKRRLARALAAIDRCVARHARAGELASALSSK